MQPNPVVYPYTGGVTKRPHDLVWFVYAGPATQKSLSGSALRRTCSYTNLNHPTIHKHSRKAIKDNDAMFRPFAPNGVSRLTFFLEVS